MRVGIFYGSSGGTTKNAALALLDHFEDAELIDMEEDFEEIDQLLEFDALLLGSSTWGQGDVQRDWVDPLYEIENSQPDFEGKYVAFFGAGDQKTHGEHFVSALGKMHDLFTGLGAKACGYVPKEGYEYTFSLAEKEGRFCGLPIDDVNQKEATPARIQAWAAQLKNELSL